MDVLTDVLQTVRVSGGFGGRIELTSPWGLEVSASDEAYFQVVLEGHCWLWVDGAERAVRLDRGDLFALPHGDEHVLRDDPASDARPLREVLAAGCRTSEVTYRYGGGGVVTTLVCGCFRFDDRRNNPLLSVLPQLILLRGEDGRAVRWLEHTLQFIASEAAAGGPGMQTVISRLADILLVQILREYLAGLGSDAHGWLGALAEPRIGAALSLIHQQPEQSWTVARLASRVGMSRSAFACRFTEAVGEPPLHYVTRWRMQKAAGLLRQERASLAEIAERVGYESEAAFSKAFKRWIGSAPGAYRRLARVTAG